MQASRLGAMVFFAAAALGATAAAGPRAAAGPKATLIAVVTDGAGKPVKGAKVAILGGEGKPPRGVTNAKGEVRFSGPPGVLQVVLEDARFPRTMGYGELKAGASVRAELKAMPATAVTGSVVDLAGKPIAGAVVEVQPFALMLPAPTKTDAQGQWKAVLTEGQIRISVKAPGKSDTWSEITIAAGQATASVTTRMADESALVVDTDCKQKGCLGGAVTVSVANSGFTQHLDAAGTSTFAHLPNGEATVSVSDDKDPRHPLLGEAKLTLGSGPAKVSIKVVPVDASASITGVLVDNGGLRVKAKPGAQLVVDVYFLVFNRRVIAAADGSFTVPNLPPGPCTLTGLQINPNDPMSGANGGRMPTKLVAPAKDAKVRLNDFFR